MFGLMTQLDSTFRPSEKTSSAIRTIRPLLILFMMLAHIYALDSNGILNNALPLNFDNWFTVYLESALAKTGVPLLSLISGYLAVLSLQKFGYFGLLRRKVVRLVWPLFWGNLIFILLITYPVQAVDPNYRADLSVYPFDPYGWFQATFAFYKLPANQPLFFLKDLFTCFLLMPLLVWVARIRYVNLVVIVWMAWKCIYLDTAFIFQVFPLWFFRFDIVFAFYLGILLFINSKDLWIRSRALRGVSLVLFPIAGAAASVLYVIYARQDQTTLFLWADFLVKVSSVVGCISLMNLLSKGPNPVSRFLNWLSPYSYSMFLTHAITFNFYHRAFIDWFGWPEFFRVSGMLYIVFLMIFAVAVAVLCRMAWQKIINRAPVRA